jgi:predicted peroxiredoxin
MKLGILVNTDRHPGHVVGLTKAALSKGHEVIIFSMDEGTRLLATPEFAELCKTAGVTMSFCGHSAKQMGAVAEGIPQELVAGSQYKNAEMNHDADRVIVL